MDVFCFMQHDYPVRSLMKQKFKDEIILYFNVARADIYPNMGPFRVQGSCKRPLSSSDCPALLSFQALLLSSPWKLIRWPIIFLKRRKERKEKQREIPYWTTTTINPLIVLFLKCGSSQGSHVPSSWNALPQKYVMISYGKLKPKSARGFWEMFAFFLFPFLFWGGMKIEGWRLKGHLVTLRG